MLIWGVSALSHDASLAVIDGDHLVFAAHSERYSRIKNDALLDRRLIAEALAFGPPDVIAWYERPLLKKLRHLRAGQWKDASNLKDLPGRYLGSIDLPFRIPEIRYVSHHESHTAAGLATSGFADSAVMVADAIGEFRTFTIAAKSGSGPLRTLHKRNYPHSLGLLYSAFTRRCGFRPNEDEYVVMGMAAFGEPRYADAIYEDFVEPQAPSFALKMNPHRGIGAWRPEARVEDLAASIQKVTEDLLLQAARWTFENTGSRNLVFMGGAALNCVANAKIAELGLFDNIWIFPNPGDAGSSVGAAAAVLDRPLRWQGPYLGTEIAGEYPVEPLLRELLSGGIVGVANGRAEFGPRALGNRSLLADPRPSDMKDRVNGVKGREPFRPFAPAIRSERAEEFFEMPVNHTPYMQFTARCLKPEDNPAIVHLDGTSRVQTVGPSDHPGLHELLIRWEGETGCPILLNTSLNSRGEPLANTVQDAARFSQQTSTPVF